MSRVPHRNGWPGSAGRLLATVAALVLCATAVVVTTAPRAEAATTFRGWEFTANVSGTRSDGLSLQDVSYNGTYLFHRISMPAMTVFYDNDVCGPYVDRIGGTSYTTEGPTEFTQDGVRWLQIGLTDQIGAYVITQMFYLSENGDLDVHVFSKGLQCNIRHDHFPFLRLDFDIAGAGNDEVRRATSGGMQAMPNEFSLAASAAVGHGWEVRDTVTGDVVTIGFDDNNAGLGGGTVIPESNYVNNRVYGRQYRSTEQTWQGGASKTLFGDGGEAMTDVVLWYSGFMPHSPEEGPALWHSTGIRMQVNPMANRQGAITGGVSDSSGDPVSGTKVDLFTERRARFLGATRTDASGTFRFDVDPGCYVLTFIAPDGATFSGGGRYQNTAVCVAAGQTAGGHDATVAFPGSGAASVGDRVTYSDGSAAAGVKLNLFTENRARFLDYTFTDANGYYTFELASPMCGVVTFIAPSGETFERTGTRYQNGSFCAAAGDRLTDIDAVLLSPATAAAIGDRVTVQGGGGVAGVKIVLYRASGDGSRGQWLRSTSTDGNGNYRFSVAAGCYVLDLVAPDGRSWVATGGRYHQQSTCLSAGGTDNSIDGVLNP